MAGELSEVCLLAAPGMMFSCCNIATFGALAESFQHKFYKHSGHNNSPTDYLSNSLDELSSSLSTL
jgi:hypothetical protein